MPDMGMTGMENAARSAPAPRPGRGVVSFVRRSSRLSERLHRAWDARADQYLLDVADPDRPLSMRRDLVFSRGLAARMWGVDRPLTVEIGTGQGENIVAAALANPKVNFLGIEVYTPGLAHTMLLTGRHAIANLRLAQVNAPELFAAGDIGVFNEVWTFFPDPWPKMRHHKRRLVQPVFAATVRRTLREGGLWRLATDNEDYALHMHEVLDDFPGLQNIGDVHVSLPTRHVGKGSAGRASSFPHAVFVESRRFSGRVQTKFERRGREAGRAIHDFTYRAVPMPVPDRALAAR